MGQHPSKDKLVRSSSERINNRERFGSFGKKGGSRIGGARFRGFIFRFVAGSSKKREVVQVTQVLTASKLSPRPAQQNATDSEYIFD